MTWRIARKYDSPAWNNCALLDLSRIRILQGTENDRASPTAVGGASDAEAWTTVSGLHSLLSAFNVDVGHQGWKAHPPLQVR